MDALFAKCIPTANVVFHRQRRQCVFILQKKSVHELCCFHPRYIQMINFRAKSIRPDVTNFPFCNKKLQMHAPENIHFSREVIISENVKKQSLHLRYPQRL